MSVQRIGVPALVTPVAPSGEQKAPACTTRDAGAGGVGFGVLVGLGAVVGLGALVARGRVVTLRAVGRFGAAALARGLAEARTAARGADDAVGATVGDDVALVASVVAGAGPARA